MSIKKPIISITKKCSNCNGTGYIYPDVPSLKQENILNIGYRVQCKQCKGLGRNDVNKKDPDFKQHYIENLEEVIEYWTRLYRNKNREAQDYLKKVSEYSKELDKIINN